MKIFLSILCFLAHVEASDKQLRNGDSESESDSDSDSYPDLEFSFFRKNGLNDVKTEDYQEIIEIGRNAIKNHDDSNLKNCLDQLAALRRIDAKLLNEILIFSYDNYIEELNEKKDSIKFIVNNIEKTSKDTKRGKKSFLRSAHIIREIIVFASDNNIELNIEEYLNFKPNELKKTLAQMCLEKFNTGKIFKDFSRYELHEIAALPFVEDVKPVRIETIVPKKYFGEKNSESLTEEDKQTIEESLKNINTIDYSDAMVRIQKIYKLKTNQECRQKMSNDLLTVIETTNPYINDENVTNRLRDSMKNLLNNIDSVASRNRMRKFVDHLSLQNLKSNDSNLKIQNGLKFLKSFVRNDANADVFVAYAKSLNAHDSIIFDEDVEAVKEALNELKKLS